MRSSRHKGFTLLEVMVVLIMAGLVTTILLQALYQVYRLQDRFGVQLTQSQDGAMRADWFRQVIQGLQADYPQGKDTFSGTAASCKGLTTGAVSEVSGLPVSFTVRVEYPPSGRGGPEVVYEAGPSRVVLFRADSGKATLAYLDHQGVEHDRWPPLATGTWPQLPGVVLLKLPSGSGSLALTAVPRGPGEIKRRAFRLFANP